MLASEYVHDSGELKRMDLNLVDRAFYLDIPVYVSDTSDGPWIACEVVPDKAGKQGTRHWLLMEQLGDDPWIGIKGRR